MSYNRNRSPEESLEILQGIASRCADLGGPLSNELYQLVLKKDYNAILAFSFPYDSLSLSDYEDVMYARQIAALYQKSCFLPIAVDRERVAFANFVSSEQRCRETNARFRHGSVHKGRVGVVLSTAQRKIAAILGDVPDVSELQPMFGPGAATNVIGSRANAKAKLNANLVCSANMAPVLGELLAETPLWASHHAASESDDSWTVDVEVSPGKLMFVPKNAKTDRSIVVEPLLNGFWQKAYGSWMKTRLKRFGCDLFEQKRNQSLAYVGSVDSSLATLDLSSASDTIAKNLVWDLLPYDWAETLDRLRTPYVEYRSRGGCGRLDDGGGSVVPMRFELEKFSSMGNGYTFELESLIFYSLTLAACNYLGITTENVSVFGDDIIVPKEAVSLLIETLSYAGFSVNTDKSCVTGNFRESCGADYFHGMDVRPFYQKTLVSDRTLYTLHNFFIRRCERELAELVKSYTNPSGRIYGPDGFGDGHLIGDHTLRYSRLVKRRGWGGGFFDTYVSRAIKRPLTRNGDWLIPSYSVYTRASELDPFDSDVVRGSKGYAKVSIYTLTTSIF